MQDGIGGGSNQYAGIVRAGSNEYVMRCRQDNVIALTSG